MIQLVAPLPRDKYVWTARNIRVMKAFNPSQPRDERGRWSVSGSSGDAGLKQYIEMVADVYPNQLTAYPFLRDHGRAYKIDEETFIGGVPQQCYKNAAEGAMAGAGTYVEGFVSVHGVPIAHAWLVEDGAVRDVTLKSPDGIMGYFGVPIKTDYLTKTLLRNKVYGILTGQGNYKQLSRLLNDSPEDIVER